MIAETLVKLKRRFRGKNFDFAEFAALLSEQGVVLEELAGDLIEPSALPGFVANHASARPYKNQQSTYYQTTFNLHNREPVSGSIALSLIYHRAVSSRHINRLPPFLVDNDQSVQVELVSRYPIKYVWIEPYLALNRMDLRVELPDFEDSNTPTHVHPNDASINSIEEISQEIQTETSITIDDLDLGFKVDGRGDLQTAISSLGRRLFGTPEIIMDKGIPVFHLIQRQSHNDAWERKVDPTGIWNV